MHLGIKLGISANRQGGGGLALTQDVRVLVLGDSTTVGVGADPTGLTDIDGSFPFSVPAQTSAALVADGIPASGVAFLLDNSTDPDWFTYRDDIALISTKWASSTLGVSLGGITQRWSAGEGVIFSPSGVCDTLEFVIARIPGAGTLTLSIDGTVHSTYGTNITPSDCVKFAVTFTPGTHVFRFESTSGSVHGPVFAHAYDSRTPAVRVWNSGVRNRKSGGLTIATGPVSPLNAIQVVDPDIVVIDIGINDWRQSGTTIATTTSNIQAVITASVAAGAKVILTLPHDVSYNTTTDAWSYAAVKTMYEGLQAANAAQCTYVDMSVKYAEAGLGTANPATKASLAAAGLFYDSLHPTAEVYEAEGAALAAEVKAVAVAQGWLA